MRSAAIVLSNWNKSDSAAVFEVKSAFTTLSLLVTSSTTSNSDNSSIFANEHQTYSYGLADNGSQMGMDLDFFCWRLLKNGNSDLTAMNKGGGCLPEKILSWKTSSFGHVLTVTLRHDYENKAVNGCGYASTYCVSCVELHYMLVKLQQTYLSLNVWLKENMKISYHGKCKIWEEKKSICQVGQIIRAWYRKYFICDGDLVECRRGRGRGGRPLRREVRGRQEALRDPEAGTALRLRGRRDGGE